MARIRPEWAEHQRKRWMRHDAHRFLRQDWQRFLKPGADPRPLLSLFEGKANFNPSQLRVPAGSPGGGRWTDEMDGDDGAWQADEPAPSSDYQPVRLAQLEGILDDSGKPYYNPGGHHEAPKSVYGKWNLSGEVRRIFDKATTGTIPNIVMRTSPDGVPQGHFWHGKGGPHRAYNEAIKDLSDDFFKRNAITSDRMTPSHALGLLKEIRESDDPRIRNYNNMIRILRRFPSLRAGRGIE